MDSSIQEYYELVRRFCTFLEELVISRERVEELMSLLLRLYEKALHFPDTDPRFEGADSLKLLEECCRMAGEEGFRPVSVDATILCQRPKLSPHIPQMISNTAAAMGCPQGSVNIKATTEEGLGFTGAGEGIAAHAVVLLARK